LSFASREFYWFMTKYIITLVAAASLSLTGCSQKTHVERTSQDFNALPPGVQKAVREYAPNAEIASVDRKNRGGISYYVIEFKDTGRNPKLTLAENGMMMENEDRKAVGSASPGSGTVVGRSRESRPESTLGAPSGTTGRAASVDLSALQLAVQKTLQAQVPDGVIKSISRHDDNGRLVYEFEFQDQGKNPTMRIAEDGAVVQTLKK